MSPPLRVFAVALVLCATPVLRADVDDRAAPIDFFVHVDVADQVDAEQLAAYVADARELLVGSQHADDVPCCTRIDVADFRTFGRPGDGFDVIDTLTEFETLRRNRPPGAYIVQTLMVCTASGGLAFPTPPLFGCGPRGEDVYYVALDTPEDTRAKVIAHERGHNVGLGHRFDDFTALMSVGRSDPRNPKGALNLEECEAFRARASSDGACLCIETDPERGFAPEALGAACALDAEAVGGCTLAGLCRDTILDAERDLRLLGPVPGAGPGLWRVDFLGTASAGIRDPELLAALPFAADFAVFAAAQGVLFALEIHSDGRAVLHRVHPHSGASARVGDVAVPGATGLAYDELRNRLYTAAGASGRVFALDPDDASAVDLGPIGFAPLLELFHDPVLDRLHAVWQPATSASRLLEIDLADGRAEPGSQISRPDALAFDPTPGRVTVVAGGRLTSWALEPSATRDLGALIHDGSPRALALHQAPACGDGFRQHPEQCDDGNRATGDGCDAQCRLDRDDDTLPDDRDPCPQWFDAGGQPAPDRDGDGVGDPCTCGDADADGRLDAADAVRLAACLAGEAPACAPDLADTDADGVLDADDLARLESALAEPGSITLRCARNPDPDPDGDDVPYASDRCPATRNPAQRDRDGDGRGDACDPCVDDPLDDPDGDRVCNGRDLCPAAFDPEQSDTDGDGLGDACDPDPDGDAVPAADDPCPDSPNPTGEALCAPGEQIARLALRTSVQALRVARGRLYAVGDDLPLAVADVTTPALPRWLGVAEAIDARPFDLLVGGERAWVAFGDGLRGFDIGTGLERPQATHFVDAPGSLRLARSAERIYVGGLNALVLVDVSHAAPPRVLARHPLVVTSQMHLDGSLLRFIGTAAGALPLFTIDFRDPERIDVRSVFTLGDGSAGLAGRGSLLWSAGAFFTSNRALDLSAPGGGALLAASSSGLQGSDTLTRVGDRLYAPNSGPLVPGQAARIFDVADPARIADAGVLPGNRGSALAIADDHAYVATRNGIDIFELLDADGDGVTRLDGDNCPDRVNPDQADTDADGVGDACQCGDVSGDGRVDALDARLVQRCALGAIPCADGCDVDGDGACSSLDARLIQRVASGRLAPSDVLWCE